MQNVFYGNRFRSSSMLILLPALAIAITLPAAVHGAEFRTLNTFPAGGVKGAMQPYGEPVIFAGGALYGVAPAGGDANCTDGCGVVYMLEPRSNPNRAWLRTTIHRFRGGRRGGTPQGQLARGPDGSLYGVTKVGGGMPACDPDGCGVIYKLTPPTGPGEPWIQTVLYRFKDPSDGFRPLAGLVIDQNDVLYGTTNDGGASNSGTVFRLSPPAAGMNAWTKTTLADIPAGAGRPSSELTLGANGRLYGSIESGGALGKGAIFEVTPPDSGDGAWSFSVIHDFDRTDGEYPWRTRLIFDAGGALYGTATYGGYLCDFLGCGIVFRLAPPTRPNGPWHIRTLYQFKGGTDGRYPVGGVVMDADGNLYGAIWDGGPGVRSVIFKLRRPAVTKGQWKKVLVEGVVAPGAERLSSPLIIQDGTLYGTTGDNQPTAGTVFRYVP